MMNWKVHVLSLLVIFLGQLHGLNLVLSLTERLGETLGYLQLALSLQQSLLAETYKHGVRVNETPCNCKLNDKEHMCLNRSAFVHQ